MSTQQPAWTEVLEKYASDYPNHPSFRFTDAQIQTIVSQLVPLISAPADHGFFAGVLTLKAQASTTNEFALFVSKLLASAGSRGNTPNTQPKGVGAVDRRFTVGLEFCGHKAPRHVVRFLGGWVAQSETEAGARAIVQYEIRVRALELEGMTRSDAQAIVDAQQLKG